MPDCPFCLGTGKDSEGYSCLHCDGAGDRESWRLLRAYNMGADDAVEALRRFAGHLRTQDMPRMGTDALRRRLAADDAQFAADEERKLRPRVVD